MAEYKSPQHQLLVCQQSLQSQFIKIQAQGPLTTVVPVYTAHPALASERWLCTECSIGCCSLTRLTCLECADDDLSNVQTTQFLSASLLELKLINMNFECGPLGSILQGFQSLTSLKLIDCKRWNLWGDGSLVLPRLVR